MATDILKGKLVRLAAEDAVEHGKAISAWDCDSEWWRLLSTEPSNLFSSKKITGWIETDQEKEPPSGYHFAIRTLDDDRLIGFIGLDGTSFPNSESFVGIGIGERQYWGKGYGTDAMRVILRYAFQELNLRRVALNTFEYNPRAIRSYEKAGFIHEGRSREYLWREGRRWDLIYMGILREEWLALNSAG